ncbi:uncharacterized protein EI97DRAFT_444651 [Westerdykella ornata]|uniref:Uncharacterized protein n=1 Tax=Westerdykella ornata TaxID=318751 RepID=A0A6A6JB69_WESOR|nr:uncharacterized protein EI97DRAFT_444651 [Westerdykella ornata]KAF2273851.1 hypothetical protein EI97DRAFT_444651 [Westerdykella ornata]
MDRDKRRKKKEEEKQQEEIAISSIYSSSSSESEDSDIEIGENNSSKVVIRTAAKPTSSLVASSFASTSNLASFAPSTPSTQKRDHPDLSLEKPRPKHIAIGKFRAPPLLFQANSTSPAEEGQCTRNHHSTTTDTKQRAISCSYLVNKQEKQMQELITVISNNIKALAAAIKPQHPAAPKINKGQTQGLTFAQVAAKATNTSSLPSKANAAAQTAKLTAKEQPFTLVQSKAAKKKEEKELFLKRKLVLITSKEDEGQEIDSLSLRNKINHCLLAVSIAKKHVVAAVSKSRGKQNIVLTTTEDYNADFLIKHKEKWQNLFRFNREQRIET